MPAVSDSSTLIHLALIERLPLLRTFYGGVVLPPAVWREVVEEGHGRPGAEAVRRASGEGWITIQAPRNEPLLRLLKHDLDEGEAEAIALAQELGAEWLLVDETDARKVAGLYGLGRTGTLGILIRGRLQGELPSLRAELD